MAPGAKLRNWRLLHGLSQIALCQRIHVNQGHLSRIERDQSVPRDELAERIEAVTGGQVTWRSGAPS